MKTKINPAAIAKGLGGVIILQLGSETPDNNIQLFNILKQSVSSSDVVVVIVKDAVSGKDLGICEVYMENENKVVVTKHVLNFTTQNKMVYRYTYSFTADGRYTRQTGTFTI